MSRHQTISTLHLSSPRAARRRGGFTFVELMLAMVVTALVGAAISAMLFAVTRGTDDRADTRSLVIQHKTIVARFDAAVRSAKSILAVGSDYIVLWMGDSRVNGAPDLSEVRRVEYDAATHSLVSYKAVFPAGYTQAQIDAADTAYTLSTDFAVATAALKGVSTFPAVTWCGSLYGWAVVLDDADVQTARLVSYRFTIGNSTRTGTVVGAAALRSGT
jgi:type II secretory pathway component PulJ